MKRSRQISPDDDTLKPKPQLRPSATAASSSPFQTLKVTKPTAGSEQQEFAKSHYMVQVNSSRHMLPLTTMDWLTPYPTGQEREESYPHQLGVPSRAMNKPEITFMNRVPNIAHTRSVVTSSETMPVACQSQKYEIVERTRGFGTANDQPADHTPALDDEYPFDNLDEEAMSLLTVVPNCIHEGHMPPSSVTRAWDIESRSADEYDATLQRSSPVLSETLQTGSKKESLTVADNQNLLDEEVDWGAVVAATSTLQKYSSPAPSQGPKACQQYIQEEAQAYSNVEMHPASDALSPFIRPPYPEKVRDRCSVPGLSSETVLRTCFRIGMMINQSIRCFGQQHVVFELFARVVYSNRETLSRTQHFQFVDLFKDRHPFPSGILTGWKVGSQLDRYSSAFLNTNSGPKLCWCLCRPIKDPRAAIGWSYIVLTIEETSWDRVEWSKRMVCGETDEHNEEAHCCGEDVNRQVPTR